MFDSAQSADRGLVDHLQTMTWYSPIVPLLVGMLFLGISAFMPRARQPLNNPDRLRPGLAMLGVFFILPGYALMTPLGANLLVLVIEYRIKSAETAPVCNHIQVAVLLSGGLNRPAETSSDFGALTPESLTRIFAWQGRDAGLDPASLRWVIAGGGPFRIAEAEVIAALVDQLDPDKQTLQLETTSATTSESAQSLRKLLPHSTNRILLASSALHLPRAKLAFEQAGFEVCPLVLNRHYLAVTGWTTLLPQSSSLAKSESALHEIIGEVFYRINPPPNPPTVDNGAARP